MDKKLAAAAANETPEGTNFLYASFNGRDGYYPCEYIPDATYAEIGGKELKLQIIRPMFSNSRFPLVVFVQGSAWRRQNVYMNIPSLCNMASRGYVIVSVEYRDTDIAQFPAQLEDVKAAIRFMRANAELYSADAQRVAVWGDSSGGHCALMAGLTTGKFDNGINSGYSDAVSAVVDFYGVTDIPSLGDYNDIFDHNSAESPEGLLIGGAVPENIEKAKEASPLNWISDEETPPILIIHGDKDGLVHVNQSIKFYKAMKKENKRVLFYKVVGGDHGGGIWNADVLDVVHKFLSVALA